MKTKNARLKIDPAGVERADAFSALWDRFHGLRCAIQGATIANDDDRRGLLQLADDLAENLAEFYAGPRRRSGFP
jgi:hypothetical protein